MDRRVTAQSSYAAALESGVARECRAELTACFRVGVRLESWLNTYTPPLASGGNVGVSGEVAAAFRTRHRYVALTLLAVTWPS